MAASNLVLGMPKNLEVDLYQSIWLKFVEGDDNALSSIYFEFFDILINFGLKYSSDRFLVEDCIQNLFVDLLKNRKAQAEVINLRFYLMKALRNQMLNEQRKIRKLMTLENLTETDFRITYSAENSLIASETDEIRFRFVKMVTEDLSARQKEALYLKFNCGFNYIQISEIMQISVESVRTIVYRTLKSIKETFGNEKHSNLIFLQIFQPLFAFRRAYN